MQDGNLTSVVLQTVQAARCKPPYGCRIRLDSVPVHYRLVIITVCQSHSRPWPVFSQSSVASSDGSAHPAHSRPYACIINQTEKIPQIADPAEPDLPCLGKPLLVCERTKRDLAVALFSAYLSLAYR